MTLQREPEAIRSALRIYDIEEGSCSSPDIASVTAQSAVIREGQCEFCFGRRWLHCIDREASIPCQSCNPKEARPASDSVKPEQG